MYIIMYYSFNLDKGNKFALKSIFKLKRNEQNRSIDYNAL